MFPVTDNAWPGRGGPMPMLPPFWTNSKELSLSLVMFRADVPDVAPDPCMTRLEPNVLEVVEPMPTFPKGSIVIAVSVIPKAQLSDVPNWRYEPVFPS